jgi:hypothetical protein
MTFSTALVRFSPSGRGSRKLRSSCANISPKAARSPGAINRKMSAAMSAEDVLVPVALIRMSRVLSSAMSWLPQVGRLSVIYAVELDISQGLHLNRARFSIAHGC